MNKTAIEKAQALLAKGQLEELKTLLDYERELEVLKANGKKPNLLKAVKAYLNNATKKRPLLRTVQHTHDGKQFICDGFSIVVWNDHKTELDVLPQTEAERCINIYAIIDNGFGDNKYTLTADELTLLKNLDKYIALYPKTKANAFAYILIGGQLFDAKLILKTIDGIINLDDITDCRLSMRYRRLSLKTNGERVMILGLTMVDDEWLDAVRRDINATAKKVLEVVK